MLLYWDREQDGETVRTYLQPHLLRLIDEEAYRTAMERVQAGSDGEFDRIENPIESGAYITWQMVTLLSGTYVFNLLALFGIPEIFIVGMTMVYYLLLGVFIMKLILRTG